METLDLLSVNMSALKDEEGRYIGMVEERKPIILEIIAEDQHDMDPVAIGEVGRGILDEVKQDGFKVEPVYTGQRGGLDLLFEIFNYVQATTHAVGADIYAQRDVISEIAGLLTIFDLARPLAMKIFKAREKHEAKQAVVAQEQHPVKISMMIDGSPITIEAANFKDAEAMLELAKKFHSAHPNVNATSQSQIKIQASVPKKARRGRR